MRRCVDVVFVRLLLSVVLLGCTSDPSGSKSGTDTSWGGSTGFTPDIPTVTDPGQPAKDAPVICKPKEARCKTGTSLETCSDDGTEWVLTPCAAQTTCDQGKCQVVKCTPGTTMGKCSGANAFLACNDEGTGTTTKYCNTSAPICVKGECKDLKCAPGSLQCQGFGAVQQCTEDGKGYAVVEECTEGTICKNASCITTCDADLKENTYFGCEYWAVDLDNIEAGQFEQVGLVVSNPDDKKTATITILNVATGTDLALTDTAVPPKSQIVVDLPKGFNIDGSVISNNSFRLRSTAPVIVHQFNPRNAASVYSNDATLLIPASVPGKEYMVMSWPQRAADSLTGGVPLHGLMAIVAQEKGLTSVLVVPTALIEPSKSKEPNKTIGPLAPNTPAQFVLEYGQVLQLETGGGFPGADLTGSLIVTDKRVSVFGGHECANVPLVLDKGEYKGTDYCDHLEQQLIPIDTWGKEVICDAFAPRSPQQTDTWRILASEDETVVDTIPPQAGVEKVSLKKGAFVEFQSKDSFMVRATAPILVGHFMSSSNYPGFQPDPLCASAPNETGIGDPSFAIGVATVQYRKDYIFLTPLDYRQNYVNIMYPTGVEVALDGVPLALELKPLGNTGWNVQTIPVVPGVHQLSSTAQFGVTAYGYDCDVSYAYPGGMNLITQKEALP